MHASAPPPPTPPGRGTGLDPPNRFESLVFESEPGETPNASGPRSPAPRTRYLRDPARTIISHNQSPDLAFEVSVNPYRGCEHGCPFCYARPTHEYLGFSAGLDFETRILVKLEAPALLRRELSARSWRPKVLMMSGVTDPYQPIERRLRLTRGCLALLAECRHPVSLITKGGLVVRDLDLIRALATHGAVSVSISLPTLDPDLARILEPRAAQPATRLAAIETLARAEVPVGAVIAPVIPGLTDHEIPRIVDAVARAGAGWVGGSMLRLPFAVKEVFVRWLEEWFPERKPKVLAGIREVRAGRLNDARFGTRLRGEGLRAAQIHELLAVMRRRAGLAERGPELSTAGFRPPDGGQLSLFRS